MRVLRARRDLRSNAEVLVEGLCAAGSREVIDVLIDLVRQHSDPVARDAQLRNALDVFPVDDDLSVVAARCANSLDLVLNQFTEILEGCGVSAEVLDQEADIVDSHPVDATRGRAHRGLLRESGQGGTAPLDRYFGFDGRSGRPRADGAYHCGRRELAISKPPCDCLRRAATPQERASCVLGEPAHHYSPTGPADSRAAMWPPHLHSGFDNRRASFTLDEDSCMRPVDCGAHESRAA